MALWRSSINFWITLANLIGRNYCVSLNGLVCKSSLDVAAKEVPESRMDNLLLSEEFLQECADKFSVRSRGPETNTRAFPQKHLNIIDALKENNNLGRSVNRGRGVFHSAEMGLN
ncbi:hypothetical protein Patl1_08653 [Pistacia atlantica]|uniref:Uncharacterized protein n=1 Tax=Pistacia atlantica TaxID=434234 RepID=A0ACC1AK16_9ROSI|nr:hypothetical protein Patl1_08653 [Pistacia atlantica]